jgi:hypothetical protein
MAPIPQNGFGAFFFPEAEKGVFAGGFANFDVQNVVFGWLIRGEFVVKTWFQSARNLAAEIFRFFEVYFWDGAISGMYCSEHLWQKGPSGLGGDRDLEVLRLRYAALRMTAGTKAD